MEKKVCRLRGLGCILPIAVVAFLVGQPAWGQERQPVMPAALTLEQALAIAREHHPGYGVQRATLAAADAEERTTQWWLRMLPTISFAAGSSVTQSRVPSGTDEFGRPLDPISFRRTASDMGPTFGRITLFDGGAGSRTARSTRAGVRSTRASVEAEAVQLESQLVRSYYTAVQRERQVAVEERLLESTRFNHEAAERLLRVGAQDPLDLLGAELAVAEAEHRLERARGDARKARLDLAAAMGVGDELTFGLADALPEVFDPASLNGDLLLAGALSGHPSLVQLEASREQSRYNLSGAQVNRWPTVDAYLMTRRGTTLGSEPTFYLNPLNQTYTLGISVNISLFDRYQASTRVAQARAQHAVATERLRTGQLQTENNVRGALIDLENVYRTLGLQERTAELSRQRLELAQEKYRLGSMSFSDLQNSVDAAYQAEHAALAARFDFVTALLALEEAAGVSIR